MTYQNLLYVVDDRAATITSNRPQRHNALNQPLARLVGQGVPQGNVARGSSKDCSPHVASVDRFDAIRRSEGLKVALKVAHGAIRA